jgi:hypothetical protein
VMRGSQLSRGAAWAQRRQQDVSIQNVAWHLCAKFDLFYVILFLLQFDWFVKCPNFGMSGFFFFI